MNIDFIMSKKVVFDFTSYILSIQIRHIVYDALRHISGTNTLRESSSPLTKAQLSPFIRDRLKYLKNR